MAVSEPSVHELLRQLRDEWREDFRDFKEDVRRDSGEMRSGIKDLREDVQELSLNVARLEEYAEENTPRPKAEAKKGLTKDDAKRGAINVSLAGLGGVILWCLQKLFP